MSFLLDGTFWLISLSLLLLSSLIANLFFLIHEPKKTDNNDNSEQANMGIVEFLNDQTKETKELMNARGPITMDNRVVALRIAYLNIERKSLDKGVASKNYWQFLSERLEKLLKIFMPKLFDSQNHISVLENRIVLLKDRISKLASSQDGESARSLRDSGKVLDAFLGDCRKSLKMQDHIDGHLKKMEDVVENFEDPEGRKYLTESLRAKKYYKKSTDSLHSLYASLVRQRENLDRLKKNMESIDLALDDDVLLDSNRKRISGEMVALESHVDDSVDKLKGENERLKKHIDSLKGRLEKYGNKIDMFDNRQKAGIVNINEYGPDLSFELRDLSDEVARVNQREIDRLREVVREQRHSIKSMEGGIERIEKEAEISKDKVAISESELVQLRQGMLDAESCIKMLEDEIEVLKGVDEDSPGELDGALSNEEMQSLNEALEKVRLELNESLKLSEAKEKILAFLEEAMKAGSLEDISFLLFETFQNYDVEPSFLVKYGRKSIDISANGKLTQQDRILIENMRVGEVNTGAYDTSIKFRFASIGGILRPAKRGINLKSCSMELVRMLKVCDRIIEKVGGFQANKVHKKDISICANQIKKVAYEVDKSYEQQFDRNKSLIKSSVGQVQDIGRSMGLEDNQLKGIKSIQDEAIKEINADDAFRLLMRKKFLSIIKQLEDAV